MEDSDEDPVKRHGVKRASLLYALPYWQVVTQFLFFVLGILRLFSPDLGL